MIKAQIPGRMVSSGISDIAINSVHSDKTYLKKLMMMKMIIIIIIIITKKIFPFTSRASSFLAFLEFSKAK